MSVCVIADPGACWKADTEAESWRRMCDLMDVTRVAGAQVFKPQLLRRQMYRDGTKAAALVADYEVPDEWLYRLKAECDDRGLELMVTAYRAEDVALIDPYVRRHKVASFDTGNERLARAIRKTRKPVLMSTGLLDDKTLSRITRVWKKAAYGWAHRHGYTGTTHYDAWLETPQFLHCVSAYPAQPAQLNMRVLIGNLHAQWARPMGFSDHTIGNTAAIMAVALGAIVIEKHIRHSATPATNPDYAAAASPEDFKRYVAAIREAEAMLGDGVKRVMPGELVQYKYDPATGRRAGD